MVDQELTKSYVNRPNRILFGQKPLKLSISNSKIPKIYRFINLAQNAENHPLPCAKFFPIWPSDSRDKNYFRFNRKWRHCTPEVTSPCWKTPSRTPYAKFYPIRPSDSRDNKQRICLCCPMAPSEPFALAWLSCFFESDITVLKHHTFWSV